MPAALRGRCAAAIRCACCRRSRRAVRYSQRVPISPPLDQFDLALEDREGNLWLNGREGLHRLRPRRLQARRSTIAVGVSRRQ